MNHNQTITSLGSTPLCHPLPRLAKPDFFRVHPPRVKRQHPKNEEFQHRISHGSCHLAQDFFAAGMTLVKSSLKDGEIHQNAGKKLEKKGIDIDRSSTEEESYIEFTYNFGKWDVQSRCDSCFIGNLHWE